MFCVATPVWSSGYPYGERLLRAGAQWPESAGFVRDQPSQTVPEARAAEYQGQLDSLEEAGGPYADALLEPLTGLGRYHESRGEHAAAVGVYRRALHVLRVNEGLYSERQVPVLRSLLSLYRDSGELRKLDERYDYYFRLLGAGRPPYTAMRRQAALGYLRWQREALRLSLDRDSNNRLLALYQLNDSLLQASAADPAIPLQWQRDLALSQLQNLYLVQDRVSPTIENRGLAPETPLIAGEWTGQDVNEHVLQRLQRRAVAAGAGMLQTVIAASAAEPVGQAQLQLALGDWYQWHGKNDLAAQQYAQVAQQLTQAGEGALSQEWLGEPVELPDNGVFASTPARADVPAGAAFRFRYDVSAAGRVSNVQVDEVAEEARPTVARLGRYLQRVRFRPRWVNGSAEPVTGLTRDYAASR